MSDFHKKVSILVQFGVVANILRLVQSPDYQSVIFSSGCLVLLIVSSDFGFDTCFKMGLFSCSPKKHNVFEQFVSFSSFSQVVENCFSGSSTSWWLQVVAPSCGSR